MTSVVPTSQTKKTIYCGGLAEEVDEKVKIILNLFDKNVLDKLIPTKQMTYILTFYFPGC